MINFYIMFYNLIFILLMGFFSDVVGAIGGALGSSGIPIVSGVGNFLSSTSARSDANAQLRWEMDWNAQQAQLDRDFQSSEAQKVRDFNLQMWNMNNDYNNPSAQLARAEAAGINPNAVIGSSGLNATSSPASGSGVPSGSRASMGSSGLANQYLTNDLQRQMMQAQIDNTETDTEGKHLDNKLFAMTFDERVRGFKVANDKLEAEGINYLAEAGLHDVDANVKQGMYDWYCKKQPLELQTMWQNLNNLRNQNFEILSRITLNKEYAKTEQKKQGLIEQQTITETHKQFELDSQAQLNYALARESDKKLYVLDKQADYLGELGELTDIQGKIADIERQYSTVTGLPLGTPEFEANFYLWCKGEQEKFYTRVGARVVQDSYNDFRETISDLRRGVINAVGQFFGAGQLPFKTVKNAGVVNPSSIGYPTN